MDSGPNQESGRVKGLLRSVMPIASRSKTPAEKVKTAAVNSPAVPTGSPPETVPETVAVFGSPELTR